MYFWPVDLAVLLISFLCSGETLVMVSVSVKLSSSVLPAPIHFLRVSPVLRRTSSAVTGTCEVPCLVDGASGKESSGPCHVMDRRE